MSKGGLEIGRFALGSASGAGGDSTGETLLVILRSIRSIGGAGGDGASKTGSRTLAMDQLSILLVMPLLPSLLLSPLLPPPQAG